MPATSIFESTTAVGSTSVCVITWGCQMNVYDSDRINDVVTANGYRRSDTPADADWVILNTCHIRDKAAEKVYSQLGQLRVLRQQRRERGGDLNVVVAGCVAQAEGEEIIRRAAVVDVVVGPQSFHRLPSLMRSVEDGEGPFCDLDFPAAQKFAHLEGLRPAGDYTYPTATPAQQRTLPPAPVSSFLTIQEGCDKFCTFCVVPYTRGSEFSRSALQICAEAESLVSRGAREITVLGQNVNAWQSTDNNGNTWRLADLFAALSEIEGLERIRYTTSHPRDMDEPLMAAHRQLPKVMPYLHLPVQSGSERVLKLMNRRHKRGMYIDLIAKVRAYRPDIALSGDFIVGFPGETEEDFEDTMELVREVTYAKAFSFCYSPRAGTPAADHANQIDAATSRQRLLRLQELLLKQQREFNNRFAGTVQPVLFEKKARHLGQIQGRTPYNQVVYAKGSPSDIGKIRNVRIDSGGDNALPGQML